MIRNSLGAVVAACLTLLIFAAPALGHAELEESDPAEGETIETPYTLTARFSEELLERSNIIVDNVAGDEVARGEPDPDDRTLVVVALPALEPGEYIARWTARTADGHTERGEIHFNVAAPATPPPATPSPTPTVAQTTAPPASGPPTSAPPTSAPPTSSPPTATPSPTATPIVNDGQNTAGGNDVLLALGLAAAALLVIGVFLFTRPRR